MKEKELKLRAGPDSQDPRIRRTPEKTKEWSDAADKAEYLLISIESELSISRVTDDYNPTVAHHLRNIQSSMNRIKQKIRLIEARVEETLVCEREWWKA